jgi:multiple sugar transport system permease protein
MLACTQSTDNYQPSWLKRLETNGAYVIMAAMVLLTLLPFVWPLLSAFGAKPDHVSGLYLYRPTHFTLENFHEAIAGSGRALQLLRNSLVAAGGGVTLAVIACTLAGYSLSRMDFRFKRALMYSILLIQVIPMTATVLPYYLMMRQVGLVNTLVGVMLGLGTAQIPFITWVMKGFFDAVPMELEEAAWLDGADRLQALFRVVFPLALPGVGAATVLAFNSAWGAFFLPLTLLSSPEKLVFPLGIFRAMLRFTYAIDYGMMSAMAIIYAAPSVLVFLFGRKYLIQGTMAGALAGT